MYKIVCGVFFWVRPKRLTSVTSLFCNKFRSDTAHGKQRDWKNVYVIKFLLCFKATENMCCFPLQHVKLNNCIEKKGKCKKQQVVLMASKDLLLNFSSIFYSILCKIKCLCLFECFKTVKNDVTLHVDYTHCNITAYQNKK